MYYSSCNFFSTIGKYKTHSLQATRNGSQPQLAGQLLSADLCPTTSPQMTALYFSALYILNVGNFPVLNR